MIKRATRDFARREKPMDHIAARIQDFALFSNADAAESKRDAAGDWKSIIGRRVQPLRPVRFRGTYSFSAFSVSFFPIEWSIAHCVVEVVHGLQDVFPIQPRQLFRQRFERVSGNVGAAVVFGAQERTRLTVKDLIRGSPW